MNSVIDLRSDTVTAPCAAMRKAMAQANVGDDVIDVDPTVKALQDRTAESLGKEAAIFMPSGTMTNQIAVRIHCAPGDEFLCEYGCHIFNYEQAAYASMSGVSVHPLVGQQGRLTVQQFQEGLRPDNEHAARTRLVCLENTHNKAGGKIQSQAEVVKICDWAKSVGLMRHLDGARLFNAAIATGLSLQVLAEPFDTVSVCFSKGLGAPVGSVLAGSKELIAKARRHRKAFGGGMRQGGILAAAALYALENNFARLADDHHHAEILAAAIAQTPGLSIVDAGETRLVDTNIVLFRVDAAVGTAPDFVARLAQVGVRCIAFSASTVRLVTHLHITAEDAIDAGKRIAEVATSGKICQTH